MDFKLRFINKYIDKRGFLSEFLTPSELSSQKFIQFFCSTIKPGESRGNHYHLQKDEWIILVQGKLRLILEDFGTKKRTELILSALGAKLPKVRIGRNIAHIVKNTFSKDATIVGYLTVERNCKLKNRWELKSYKFK